MADGVGPGPAGLAAVDCAAARSGPAGLLPRDLRARLLIALALGFGFAAVREVALLPLLALVAGGVVALSGAGRALLPRLKGPALLALGFAVLLPFLAGQTVLWQAGPLAIRAEGLAAGALIGGRLLAIVAVTLALFHGRSALDIAGGLAGLGLPRLMSDLALLTLRYLDELRGELARATLARRLRGGGRGWRALGEHGMILAAALLRAQARSERIWAAMRLRGHAAALAAPQPRLARQDLRAVAVALGAALAIAALDRSL
jgi:cobalt/nickel transport system permease protein